MKRGLFTSSTAKGAENRSVQGKDHRRGKLKLAAIMLGLALCVVVPFLLFGEQLELLFQGQAAMERLQSYGKFAWLAAIGLLVSDLLFPIPTTTIMAALGMIYGPLLGGLAASVGAIVSGLTGYGICRYFGRPVALRLSGTDGLAQGEKLFSQAGGWIVALSRWLPVVSEVIACTAGLSKMRFAAFLGALICGSVPLGFAYAAVGYLGGDYPVATMTAAGVLPFVLWFFARPYLKKSR